MSNHLPGVLSHLFSHAQLIEQQWLTIANSPGVVNEIELSSRSSTWSALERGNICDFHTWKDGSCKLKNSLGLARMMQ